MDFGKNLLTIIKFDVPPSPERYGNATWVEEQPQPYGGDAFFSYNNGVADHPGDLAEAPFVLLPREAGPGLYDRILALCAGAGFVPDVVQDAVEWQTVCALVETGLGVSLAPASIRRIRLKGVAFRAIEPGAERTRVAVAWRKSDRNPLVAHLLATVSPQSQATR